MTSQEALRRSPIVDIVAQPVSRTGPTEQVRASTADSTTVPPAVPAFLGFVAGYVDSCTFLAFNGLFVAQLTGSFVVAGSELVANNEGFLIKVLAIPVFFAAGVLTTVIVRAFGAADRRALGNDPGARGSAARWTGVDRWIGRVDDRHLDSGTVRSLSHGGSERLGPAAAEPVRLDQCDDRPTPRNWRST